MRKSFSKITLAATLGLALAFTVSCSDDDDDNGGWLKCDQLYSLGETCYNDAAKACDQTDSACLMGAMSGVEECVMKQACNGTSTEECTEHYKDCDTTPTP